eukprot:425865-Amphidinium_carterae.1
MHTTTAPNMLDHRQHLQLELFLSQDGETVKDPPQRDRFTSSKLRVREGGELTPSVLPAFETDINF